MKKILIIMGNPRIDSYSSAIAKAYLEGVEANGNEGKILNLIEYSFDYSLKLGSNDKTFEPDIQLFMDLVKSYDHLVFIYPTWRYNMTSIMKGFLDRVFLSGFAYKFKSRFVIDGLLKGKTATVITSTDGPWIYYLFMGNPGLKSLITTLKFCGIKIRQVYTINSLRHIDDAKRKQHLSKVKLLGHNL